MKSQVRILIVEDSDVVRVRLHNTITDAEVGEIVGEASTYDEAIEKGKALRPDLIILDINLGGTQNGFDVLCELRKENPDVITAVLTNYATPAYRVRAAELGADFFFDKSNEFEELTKIFNWI